MSVFASIILCCVYINLYVHMYIPLQYAFENHYKYKAKQSHFDKENEETIEISCDLLVKCEAGELIV